MWRSERKGTIVVVKECFFVPSALRDVLQTGRMVRPPLPRRSAYSAAENTTEQTPPLALIFTLPMARPPTREHSEDEVHDVQSWSGAAAFGTLWRANIRGKEVAMKRFLRRTVFVSLVVVVLHLKAAVPEELPAWGVASWSGEEPPSS